MNKELKLALCLGLTVSLTLGLASNVLAELPEEPLSKVQASKSAFNTENVSLPAVAIEPLRNKALPTEPGPIKFASPFQVDFNLDKSIGWTQTNYQGQQYDVLKYRLTSPNAYSLNLGFSKYNMPDGGKMFVYIDGYENLLRPFTADDNEDHGQLWLPVVDGKQITIEINIPSEQRKNLELELDSVNQGFLDIHNLQQEVEGLKSGSCNIDVACPQSSGWADQIRSVAIYTINGQGLCTGAAINTTSEVKPYFLTADHCGVSASIAPTVVAFWNFNNSTCRPVGSASSGSNGDGPLTQFNSGAILRADFSASDMTLLEFDDPLLPGADIYLAGWSRSTATPNSGVAIHHPAGGEKRISFENNPLIITSYLGASGSGTTHFRVFDWDAGTTEGGSSGSPLFDVNKRIVGQLHGGFAACGNNLSDWYGRLSVSWTGGGQNSSRLSNWLDPTSTGAVTRDGRDVDPDQYEADNDSANATVIQLGASQQHNIVPVTDQDWVKFTLTEETSVVITTKASAGADTRMWLYNAAVAELDFNDNAGSGVLTSRIRADDLPAGEYFVRVDESGNDDSIRYTLQISTISEGDLLLDIVPAIMSGIK
ncbi:MAG: trypsin-like serine peptidase [Arenicella sp.]